MEIVMTALALLVIVLGTIITITGKPLEFTTPKWMEWVQRLAEFKF